MPTKSTVLVKGPGKPPLSEQYVGGTLQAPILNAKTCFWTTTGASRYRYEDASKDIR